MEIENKYRYKASYERGRRIKGFLMMLEGSMISEDCDNEVKEILAGIKNTTYKDIGIESNEDSSMLSLVHKLVAVYVSDPDDEAVNAVLEHPLTSSNLEVRDKCLMLLDATLSMKEIDL